MLRHLQMAFPLIKLRSIRASSNDNGAFFISAYPILIACILALCRRGFANYSHISFRQYQMNLTTREKYSIWQLAKETIARSYNNKICETLQ